MDVIKLFKGEGGHRELAGPAPLPGGVGDVEAEERRPVEGHLVEALGCAVGEEAAAEVAAQVLGDCGDRGRGQGHHAPTLSAPWPSLGAELARPQPRATQPTHSFASPRCGRGSDFFSGRDYFSSLILSRHGTASVLQRGRFWAQSCSWLSRMEHRDTGRGGAGHARDPAVTPGSPRVQECGAGAKPVWG